jgi:predicted transcriptional regulator
MDIEMINKINSLYEEGFSVTKIAKEMHVSKSTVSRLLQKNPKYFLQKEKNKQERQEKHKEYVKQYINQKRQREKEYMNQIIAYFFDNLTALDFIYEHTEEKISKNFNIPLHTIYNILSKDERYEKIEKMRENAAEAQMQRLHQIEVNATVKRRRLSESTVLESCLSAYEFDPEKEQLVFTEKYGKKPADLKKYYKVHTETTIISEIKNKIEEEKRTSEVEKQVIEK